MPLVYLAEPSRCSIRTCRVVLRTVERCFMNPDGSVICLNCYSNRLNDEPVFQSPPVPAAIPEPEPEPAPAPEPEPEEAPKPKPKAKAKPKRRRKTAAKKAD